MLRVAGWDILGGDAMSLADRLLYGVGFTPWEHIATLPDVTEQISALFDREEDGRRPPYGEALDLGCGSGIWAVKLGRTGLAGDRRGPRPEGAAPRPCAGTARRRRDPPRPGRRDEAPKDRGRLRLSVPDRLRPVPRRADRRAARRHGPGGDRGRRAWRHAADDGLGAQAPRPPWRGASRDDITAAYPEWTCCSTSRPSTYPAPRSTGM